VGSDAGAGKPLSSAAHTRISPLAWSFVIAGAYLRITQYAFNRSLFVDEAALALNLRDRSWSQLLGPLDFAQTGPPGFLLLQKLVLVTFGPGELALRFVPLLCGVLALPLFVILASRILPRHATTLAVGLLAFSQYHVFWSSDLKPYAVDVLAAIGLLLLAIRVMRRPEDRAVLMHLGAAGAIAPYFSHAAVIIMAAVGCALLAAHLRDRSKTPGLSLASLARLALLWLLAAPALLHALLTPSARTTAYLDAFWGDGFLPIPASIGALSEWGAVFNRVLFDPIGMQHPALAALFVLAAAAGALWLVRNRPRPALLILAPVVAAILLSLAHLYPLAGRTTFTGRSVLFLVPLAYILAGAGIAWERPRSLAFIGGAILLVPTALVTLSALPISRGEARSVLAHTTSKSRDGDVVYLYYALRPALEWYRPPIAGTIVLGRCAQGSTDEYVADLARLRGGDRVWIVQAYDLYHEAAVFREYMRLNAVQIDSVILPHAELRLYDFSRARSEAAPGDLAVPGNGPMPPTDCDGVFRSRRAD
jgi:hypothetical protein